MNRVAIAEKSGLIAVAGKRYGLHLHSIKTRNFVKRLIDPSDPEYTKEYPSNRGIYALAFTPDESLLISGDEASQINIWDVKQGRLVQTLNADAGRINSFELYNNGKYLAVATQSGQLQIWDLTNFKKMNSHPGAWYDKYNKYLPASSIVFAPNKNQFLITAECGVFWWDYKNSSQKPLPCFKGQSYASCQINLSPSGKYLSMPDKLWDLDTGKMVLKITKSYQAKQRSGERINIDAATFSADEKSLIVLTNDRMLIVFDIQKGKIKSKWKMRTGGPIDNRLRLLDDNKTIAVFSDTLHFLDLKTGEQKLPAKPVTTQFKSIKGKTFLGGPYALSKDGSFLVSRNKILDANTLKIKNDISIPNLYAGGIKDVAISNDNTLYAACAHAKDNYYIGIWNLNTQKRIHKIPSNCLQVMFSLVDNTLIYLDHDLFINKVDVQTGKTLFTIKKYQRILTGTEDVPRSVNMAISNGYLYLAINTKYHHGYIARHHLNDGKLDTSIKHPYLSWVGQMTLSMDGKYLAINTYKLARDKATVMVFDIKNKKIVSRFKHPYAGSTALAFSAGNSRIFAAYDNYLIHSWSIPNGKPFEPIRIGWGERNSGVRSLIFSPNGDHLYISGKIWDMRSYREMKISH